MAKFEKPARSGETAPRDEYEVLPAGTYTVVLVDSKEKDSKSSDSKYIEMWFQIDEDAHPELAGRKLVDRIMTKTSSVQAKQISQKKLESLIYAALGPSAEATDSEELHNYPVDAIVTVKKGTGEYGDQNQIRTYKPAGSAEEAKEPVAASSGTKRPSWAQSKR